jgi:hypothetical protein
MELVYLTALTLIASMIGTMTGFGTSTIMVPVLSWFLPLPLVLLFVGVIHWFGDIWKMLFFKKGFNWLLILLFGIPGIIASFWAARLPLALPEAWLQRSLGLFLVLYVAFLWFKPTWKMKPATSNALLGGTLSGFFSGVFGVGGAVRSTFLSAFDLPKPVFLFTSGMIGFMIDSSRVTQYLISGIRLDGLLLALTGCIPASLLGAYLAKKLVDKMPRQSFRLFIALALFVVGWRYLLLP